MLQIMLLKRFNCHELSESAARVLDKYKAFNLSFERLTYAYKLGKLVHSPAKMVQ